MPHWVPAALYREFITRLPIACVDVAIVDRGAVLLVKRKDDPARGEWWVPGGRVWKGEKLRDTAARKAREEVGLDCHVGPIIHTAETIFPDGPGGIPIHSINACFFLYPVKRGGACEPGSAPRGSRVGADHSRGPASLRGALS